MTTAGGIGHTLPFLIPYFYTATVIALVVVIIELSAIAWIQWRYMEASAADGGRESDDRRRFGAGGGNSDRLKLRTRPPSATAGQSRSRRSRVERNLVVLVRRQDGGAMQPNSFDVIRIPTNGPGDVSGLMALIDSGALEPSSIVAVLGKTEGNGGVNDFTREYAVAALCNALSSHLKLAPREVEARIAFVMSGGTEGVLSPHITVFARSRRPESVGEKSEREATERRHRAYPRLPAGGDWPRRADRRDDQGRRGGDARRIDRGRQRRAFCPDQMPAC